VPSRVIEDSVLRRKHLLVLDVGDVVKVPTAVEHVLAVGVQVPVEEVGGGVGVHVTVGNEAHVGVPGPDCSKEGNVILHIPGFATVLQRHHMVRVRENTCRADAICCCDQPDVDVQKLRLAAAAAAAAYDS